MIPYKENNEVGNELLPIQLYMVEMNNRSGVKMRMISGLGREFVGENSLITETLPHWHTYLEILYFLEGSAVVQINDRYFEVCEGNVVLLDILLRL